MGNVETVFVVSKDGTPLMPTTRRGWVRHALKNGRAVIFCRYPFTIQLTYDSAKNTQPIELCVDTGYEHIGISLKSEKKEYISEQRDLLPDEKQKHDSQRQYRRTRRNRLRHRKCRFNKDTKPEGWIAPSLKNKADRHIDLIDMYCKVVPITDVYLEMGEFDTQVLKAMAKGEPVPEGEDYQHGDLYGAESLRSAVFARDGYKCLLCGRGVENNAILHEHHLYFWMGRHGNQLDELGTICEKCHTSANHEQGGKLWGFDPHLMSSKQFLAAPAFMNTVRWYIYNTVVEHNPAVHIHTAYGAATKLARKELHIEKSHANDAYVMGKYRPPIRAKFAQYKKVRRSNRCLEKFYDAQYIDIRDKELQSQSKELEQKKDKKPKQTPGKSLGCERTNRREPRNSPKNLRIYHGKKLKKGTRSIRKTRYDIRPGDVLLYENKFAISNGVHGNGTRTMINGKSVSLKKVKIIKHIGGWRKVA